MHPLPHVYTVSIRGEASGEVPVEADGLPVLATASPKEFDGPGDRWSPESLLAAAVASCLVLTFRAVARASKFSWQKLDCTVKGTLERSEGAMRFTNFTTDAVLVVEGEVDEALARRLVEKAEHGCLIANSLTATRTLNVTIARA